MTDSLTTTSTESNVYSQFALQASTDNNTELDQEDFLSLMTAQISNQDPLNPADSNEFFSQIADFSQVSGLETLNESMSGLAVQMSSSLPLQAASLVGHDVLVASATGTLDADGLEGAVETASSGAVALEIKDASGAVVRTMSLGDQEAGMVPFAWDGLGNDGEPLPPGEYTLAATVTTSDGSMAATTYIQGEVESVTFEAEGMMLAVDGMGSIPFGSIREIS